VRESVTRANDLQPDLILLTGDYVLETADSIFELAPVLAELNATHGIYAVLGNHDHWTDAGVVRQGLKESGLPVLHNEGVAVGVGTGTLYVAGIDDSWSGQPDLEAALSGLPASAPAVLLAHEPDFADKYLADGRVALQLSGHSHGGQVRLPGVGPLVLPRFGQKYHNGLNRVQNSWVYTTRGIGVIGPPVRFNCPPEITEITLTTL
jgi:predicted MPP superfamily phosphohydrolase